MLKFKQAATAENFSIQRVPMKTEVDELIQRRMQILAGLAKGEQAVRDGRVMTHEDVKKSFAKWLEPKAGNTYPQ